LKRLFVVILFIPVLLFADGQSLDSAWTYYKHKEYYNAITECLRYEHLYPQGNKYGESMILKGKSYFMAGREDKALDIFYDCHKQFHSSKEGEEGLFLSGVVRILSGSYNFFKIYQLTFCWIDTLK